MILPALLPALLLAQAAAPTTAAPSAAVPATAACTTALPPELAGWSQVAPAAQVGQAFVVPTGDPLEIKLAVPVSTARAGAAAMVPFEVATTGTYRVALSEGGWIDVVSNGRSLPSTAHAHGPACSGIAKIVDFSLAKGRYVLQLSGLKAASVRALIVAAK